MIARHHRLRIGVLASALALVAAAPGFAELVPGSSPQSGDVFFLVEDAAMHPVPQEILRRLVPIDRREFESPLPLLLMNARARAGWWSHIVGAMPYVVSGEPVSTVQTFRIR